MNEVATRAQCRVAIVRMEFSIKMIEQFDSSSQTFSEKIFNQPPTKSQFEPTLCDCSTLMED